eukprot:1843299-Alexandrium_andersonii.AAC.1
MKLLSVVHSAVAQHILRCGIAQTRSTGANTARPTTDRHSEGEREREGATERESERDGKRGTHTMTLNALAK